MIRAKLREAAPELSRRIDALAAGWVGSLLARLDSEPSARFRAKQVNDPIWGTIDLMPAEVALLDTPLMQRMRGVRQLGLAQLVFPGACHDRLEHMIGVIGGVEQTIAALSRQIERFNLENSVTPLKPISKEQRELLRLAALFHDLGHGPFSHALEPVLEAQAVLARVNDTQPAIAESEDWRGDLEKAAKCLQEHYTYDSRPPPSELVAVLIVVSDPVWSVFKHPKFPLGVRDVDEVQNTLVASITGAIDGPGASHLCALLSGQLDADKLDYLQRDAHHSGLEIGFDVSRMMSKIEVLPIRAKDINASIKDLRDRVAKAPEETLLQVGIAASGFGSFEQMLIGRTFLYDRLYHHHKVRAAEAMAQRVILLAERDGPRRLEFEDIFVDLGDEAFLRVFAGDVTHARLPKPPAAAASLASAILRRELLHRAYALRGRFISVSAGVGAEGADEKRRALWGRIVKDLDSLKDRYDLGAEIHSVANQCVAAIIGTIGKDKEAEARHLALQRKLAECGPEQVILDLPPLKASGIKILARYPSGALRIPEFSFNPYKWSNAYELQKRTTYVFCPRDVVPIIALASNIVFFGKYGVALAEEADGFTKSSEQMPSAWIDAIVAAGIIDDEARECLFASRRSLLRIEATDLAVPDAWLEVDEDLASRLAVQLNDNLDGGLSGRHLAALTKVLAAMWRLVDEWHSGGATTAILADEAELQAKVRQMLGMAGITIEEGSAGGGGKLDLFLESAILLENKFSANISTPASAPAAGMQGRRYAVALNSRVVLVAVGYQAKPGDLQGKTESVTVHAIRDGRARQVEVRFMLPYGAVVPSREKASPVRATT